MSIAMNLRSFLDDKHTPYQVMPHTTTYTAMEAAQALHVPGKELAKVVIVKADDRYCMAVLPAPYRVDMAALAQEMGAGHAELATEKEIRRLFPEWEVGAMPPFGNLYGLPVCVDRSLTEDKEIVFDGGNHQEAVKMTYHDFEDAVHPKILSFRRAD
jgi:Ala-tRNA(Pro) deacylase